jgi:hypothetical protein
MTININAFRDLGGTLGLRNGVVLRREHPHKLPFLRG